MILRPPRDYSLIHPYSTLGLMEVGKRRDSKIILVVPTGKGGGHWLVGCDEQWSGRTGVSADLSGQPAGKFMRLTGKKDRRLGGLTGGMGGLIG